MASGGLFGAIEAQYEALSPRDRRAIGVLGLFMSVVFVGGLMFTLKTSMDARAESIRLAKVALGNQHALIERHYDAMAIIDAAEKRVKEYEGQAVSTFLEKIATKTAVSEEMSVNKQTSEMEGQVRATRYRVQLRRVGYDKVVAFIYEVEVSGYPVRVESSEIRTQLYKGEKVYNLTLDLVHYEITEGEG